jgi:hypothetical protein
MSQAVTGASVEDVLAGCSTSPVAGLDAQIIDEVNCENPGVLSPVPKSAANFSKGTTTVAFMVTPARDALLSALAAKPGMTLTANSMLRTVVQQYLLYRWYQLGRCGIQLAALPGNSNHETGLAIDTSQYDAWKPTLEAHGFRWLGSSDVVHFDYVGAGAKNLRGEDVRAFQRLWNLNNPSDKITVDGDYGPATESRIKQSPPNGFAIGASCTKPDADAGTAKPVDNGGIPTTPPAAATTGDAPAPDRNDFLPPTAHADASDGGCKVAGGAGDPTLIALAIIAIARSRRRARASRAR